MNNLKRKIAMLLTMIIIGIAIFPVINSVYAAEACQVSMTVKMGSTTMVKGSTYTVKGGETVTVTASSAYGIAFIGYRYQIDGKLGVITDGYSNKITFKVPEMEAGKTIVLLVEAVANNDNGTPNTITKTGWITYYLRYEYEDVSEKEITTTMNGKTLVSGKTYEAEVGTGITIKATPADEVTRIAYAWDSEEEISSAKSTVTLKVPTKFEEGEKHTLWAAAIYNDNTVLDWEKYYIVISGDNDVEPSEKEITAKIGSKILSENTRITVNTGTSINLIAKPEDEVIRLYYAWDDEVEKSTTNSTYTIKVPSSFDDGTNHTLYVWAKYSDGEITDEYIYKFTINEDEEEVSEKEIIAKIGSKILSENTRITVSTGTSISLIAEPEDEVVRLYYSWDDDTEKSTTNSTYTIKVPSSFDDGTRHTLYVWAKYDDGTILDDSEYLFLIDEEYDEDEEDDDDELIIEPWMKENDELGQLSVSLRNDSENTKYNKNIYELDEEIIYYVDYKNGGKDITSKVTLVLNLPLNFKAIDTNDGSVSSSKNTITWTFSNGLENDESGTKEVVLKYTSLGKSKIYSKVVYPYAEIKKDTKVIDTSAVVNLIFKSIDQEINETHFPYMYGDKGLTTFRPDDTITRAEVALVLTRVLGISTNGIKVTQKYSDIYETYEEAQRAIIAVSSYGLFNGYPDGTFRPNEPMTRAELMKILATRIELQAEDDEIEGLEIKDYSNSIKLYKTSISRYIIGGETYYDHWAIDHVTLLARLNMTEVSNKVKDLRLDDSITRAEMTQLINFFLLRAPVRVTSRTTTQFSDVSRAHKLYADIIEATTNSHIFTYTEDGRENIEY